MAAEYHARAPTRVMGSDTASRVAPSAENTQILTWVPAPLSPRKYAVVAVPVATAV
jgi:hypothetical protein